MDDPHERAFAMDGTIEDWATESLQVARRAYLDPATGQRIEPGDLLGESYRDASLPLAERQLLRGGARLAWVPTDTLRPE